MGTPHRLALLIRTLRNTHGHSLAQLAAHCSIPAVVIGSYERGDRQMTLSRADEILAVYGLRLATTPIPTTGAGSPYTPAEAAQALREIARQLDTHHTETHSDGPART